MVIPEHDGKLNGKWFSSRANMIQLNNSIHAMTLMKFGLEFMDGSKKGSVKRVEQLKHESEARAYEQQMAEKDRELKALDEQIGEKRIGLENFDEIWALGLEAWHAKHDDVLDDAGDDTGNTDE
jgi:hypothetical protein